MHLGIQFLCDTLCRKFGPLVVPWDSFEIKSLKFVNRMVVMLKYTTGVQKVPDLGYGI